MSQQTDIAGKLLGSKGSVKPQDISADDTYVAGAIVDRIGFLSALAAGITAITTSGGVLGATVPVTVALFHGDEDDLSDEVLFDSYVGGFTWAANGANNGCHILPLNLETAKRYIRAKIKQTKTGTVTISAALGGVALILGGLDEAPNADHANAGYQELIEAS